MKTPAQRAAKRYAAKTRPKPVKGVSQHWRRDTATVKYGHRGHGQVVKVRRLIKQRPTNN